MSQSKPREAVEQFFYNLDHIYDDPPTNPLSNFDDEVVFTVTGQTPMSKTHYGLKTIIEGHAAAEEKMFIPPKTYRAYPIEWFEEDDKVALVTRVRLETRHGVPYNGVYFFFFRVADGKLVRIVENVEESLAWQTSFDVHLEPE